MRYILSLLTVSALATLLACQAASTANTSVTSNGNKTAQAENSPPKTGEKPHDADHAAEAEAPRITLADAKKDFDAGNVVFVDTRAEVAYKNEHIKGSINMPMEGFEMRYKEIPTDKKIIAYCS